MPASQTLSNSLDQFRDTEFHLEKQALGLDDVWKAGTGTPVSEAPRASAFGHISSSLTGLSQAAERRTFWNRVLKEKPVTPRDTRSFAPVSKLTVRHFAPSTRPAYSKPPVSTGESASFAQRVKNAVSGKSSTSAPSWLSKTSLGQKAAYGGATLLGGIATYKLLKHYQRKKQEEQENGYRY